MNLSEWRAARATEMKLPSGLVVKIKAVTVLDLAMSGQIPAPLMAGLEKVIGAGDSAEFSLATFSELAPAINALVKAAVVDPPVADQPDDEHLGVEELSAIDRFAIFKQVHQASGAGGLGIFRQGQEESVAAAQSGDGV